jgi:hypothetical protein
MKDTPTGLMFSPVPTEYLSFVWDSVSKVLKKSVATAKGKYEVDDLFNCIMEDEIVLWIVVDHDKDDEIIAAITTRLIDYPRGRSMGMDWIGGTRMKEWLPMAQNVISRYAKDHNCKYLEGYGRKGWGRWLGKYGWKPDYIAYKMELS